MSTEQKTEFELPPTNALRVYRWADLPNLTASALYRVTDPGQEPREIHASKHKRQVLEGLMRSPLYAASYCRLSDNVLPLRRDDGVNIGCKLYRNDPETGRQRYGIYFLVSTVELIEVRGVAA
ncbi:hypothetical protein [Ruegeria atlantica]|uniref:Uncharacterized protein n=1 Tax=Ruegeria atlantica TaxID=81569 RepID=A0A0P1EA45_9RHOB|nr:hypothetical protein [Ruegeria atlantica]CUH45419.1 hypothetical protein RUM4293_04333 [Ruegeria atlantica]